MPPTLEQLYLITKYYRSVGLDFIDIAVVLDIFIQQQEHPGGAISVKDIALRLDISVRAVQTHISAIKHLDLLTCTPQKEANGGQAANTYDLTPLYKAVKAEEEAERASIRAYKRARVTHE